MRFKENAQQPDIKLIDSKLMLGKMVRMSMANNRTRELWSSFMPERGKIVNNVDEKLYSLSVFDQGFSGDPQLEFQKWALVEVNSAQEPPQGMQYLRVPEGLYAVFIHYGKQAEYLRTFLYIFNQWLPDSGYVTDNRPHFEVMDHRYKPMEDDSEEEIWIPVKPV